MKSIDTYLHRFKPKRILGVFPHPDDESFTIGGLLLKASKLGIDTNVLCLTRGEYGKSLRALGNRLGRKRVKEFRRAMEILDVKESHIGTFKDGFLRYSSATITKYVEEYIEKYNPELVVTYDPGGMTGHPDHIALSKATLDICKRKNIPLLFYSPKGLFRKLFKNRADRYRSIPNYILKNGWNHRKARAFFVHKSQLELNNIVMKFIIYLIIALSPETYHLVDYSKEYRYKYFPFEF